MSPKSKLKPKPKTRAYITEDDEENIVIVNSSEEDERGQLEETSDSDNSSLVQENVSRARRYFTDDQYEKLMQIFNSNRSPSRRVKDKLADDFKITTGRIDTWFRNQRSEKSKTNNKNNTEYTESDDDDVSAARLRSSQFKKNRPTTATIVPSRIPVFVQAGYLTLYDPYNPPESEMESHTNLIYQLQPIQHFHHQILPQQHQKNTCRKKPDKSNSSSNQSSDKGKRKK